MYTNVDKQLWACCNNSAGVAVKCVVHHERDVREEQHHIYVARTSNNRVISSGGLYCCLLPQREALRIFCSGFPIAISATYFGLSDRKSQPPTPDFPWEVRDSSAVERPPLNQKVEWSIHNNCVNRRGVP